MIEYDPQPPFDAGAVGKVSHGRDAIESPSTPEQGTVTASQHGPDRQSDGGRAERVAAGRLDSVVITPSSPS